MLAPPAKAQKTEAHTTLPFEKVSSYARARAPQPVPCKPGGSMPSAA